MAGITPTQQRLPILNQGPANAPSCLATPQEWAQAVTLATSRGYAPGLRIDGLSASMHNTAVRFMNSRVIAPSDYKALINGLSAESNAELAETIPAHRSEPSPEPKPEAATKPSLYSITAGGVTLAYRAKHWTLKRLLLDLVQNHLPSDSGGTAFYVEFLQNGDWIDFRKRDPKVPVEAVRIRDDGSGYHVKRLELLDSTKTDDPYSIGQFGEGLKLAAAAALRLNLDLTYQSRNWSAAPYAYEFDIDGKKTSQLAFQVTESESSQKGSVTLIRNPPAEFIDEVLALPRYLLEFAEYEVLYPKPKPSSVEREPIARHGFSSGLSGAAIFLVTRASLSPAETIRELSDHMVVEHSEAAMARLATESVTRELASSIYLSGVDCDAFRKRLTERAIMRTAVQQRLEARRRILQDRIIQLAPCASDSEVTASLFVKGNHIQDLPHALFSYDLITSDVTPDRNIVNHDTVLRSVGKLLWNCDNPTVIKAILSMAAEQTEMSQSLELEALAAELDRSSGLMSHSVRACASLMQNSLLKQYLESSIMQSSADDTVGGHNNPNKAWSNAFYELFGKNAVLADPRNLETNKEAEEAHGKFPVQLPQPLYSMFVRLGIPQARSYDTAKSGAQIEFVDETTLTAAERVRLAKIPEILSRIPGIPKSYPPIRIVNKITLATGEVSTDALGFHTTHNGKVIIGIHRKALSSWRLFAHALLHEFGHEITGAGDHDRKFTFYLGDGWTVELLKALGLSDPE